MGDWPAELMDTLASASLQELLDTVLTSGCHLEEATLQDQAHITAIEQQLQLVERSIITTTASPPAGPVLPQPATVVGGGVIRSGASSMVGGGQQQQHHRILQQRVSLPGDDKAYTNC